MEDTGGSTKIEKLNDTNYHAWKQKILLLLILKDLDAYIVQEAPPKDDGRFSQWVRGDKKAQAIIGLSLSDEHLEHVRNVSSAKQMWDVIKDVFERHTLLNKLNAIRNFYTVSMQKDEKMLKYLNRVTQLASTLKSMDVTIQDEELAMSTLCGLPPAYEHLIVALDALGNDSRTFTFEFVKSRLIQEEQRIHTKDLEHSSSDSSALFGVRTEHERRPNPRNRLKCTHCNRFGHTADRCWGKDLKKRFNPRGTGNDSKDSAFVGSEKDESKSGSSEDDFVCLMSKIKDADMPAASSSWIIDSGCTAHMTFDREVFSTYTTIANASVEMGTRDSAAAVGRGDVIIKIQSGSSTVQCKLENVLHVPSFKYSLISVSTMDKKGLRTTFENGYCEISRAGKALVRGTTYKGLYILKSGPSETRKAASVHLASLQRWHERFAHVSKEGISSMVKQNVVHGVKISNMSCNKVCQACVEGKAHRGPISKERSSKRSSGLLDLVHSDVCGPMEADSIGGSRYFVTFIDDFSNWVTVYPMKHKSETAGCYLKFEKLAERHTGKKIRVLRSDRGGEYLSEFLHGHLENAGIKHELTVAYTPHQNGVAERMNRTLVSLVRSMLHGKGLSKDLWAEALATAVYIRNRVTCRSIPRNKTPHHIWNGKTPALGHLRVFGSVCWYLLPKQNVKKLDARSTSAIFIGYSESSKAYKLLNLNTNKVIISKDVTFDEDIFPTSDTDLQNTEVEMDTDNGVIDGPSSRESRTESDGEEADQPEVDDGDEEDDEQQELMDTPALSPRSDSAGQVLRSGRVSKPPGSWWNTTSETEHHNALVATATMEIPKSFKEAVSGPNANFWKKGIYSEIESLKKYNTWKIVPRSAANGKKILTTKWVFVEKKKVDSTGVSIPFPKGRNVVRGFEQVQGVDYNETFAPVVKYTSVRALCANVAEEDLEFDQMDAKTAFLNGKIDEDLFIEIPEGVEIDEADVKHLGIGTLEEAKNLDLVCKLEKSMYGTKQAPRCWNMKINSVLSGELGFQRAEGDPCLYVKHEANGVMMIALYVDDLLLAAKSRSQILWMKNMLNERFEMKDLGEARVCLGLEITRDRNRRKLHLSQQAYIKTIVERFGMSHSKPFATPMEEPKSMEERLEYVSDQDKDAINVPYREAIGSLMYLMIGTRPDIAYSVCKLARFCEIPKWKHWLAVKRVLRYVHGTSNMGLLYDLKEGTGVYGYSDSDWAGDVGDRKSTSAYVFMMSNAAISWCSRKQSIVATSSCEAEYVALSMTCKEAVWLKRLLSDIPIQCDLTKGMRVFTDSQSAMKLGTNESINRRNKHIDITHHYVREVTSNGEVTLLYVPTSEMVADMLNKPLGRVKFEKLRRMCGVCAKGEI